MDAYTIATLGKEMREEQRKYFALKGVDPRVKAEQLAHCRDAERKFDRAIEKFFNPTLL